MRHEQIGKYKIVGKIGQGAMGEVYKAVDPLLNREVALKTIAGELVSDETLRRRFQREAQSAARLAHPNIVTVYDFGEHENTLYMAMELLDGIDLKQAITRSPMSLTQKLDVMEQICEGLAFAHAHDIVHRDLKPANIHVLPSGKVKIMDFGLARLSGSEMTRTGIVLGTPHYMSPEQVKGVRADARSDIFSLGSVFYELLTGHKAFDAETMHAVLYKVMQEDPPPPARERVAGVPAVVYQVVDKSLAKDPAERFQDAGAMLAALRKTREAVAAGRGDTLIPELGRTPASRAASAASTSGGSAPAAQARAEAAAEASRVQTRRASGVPLLLLGTVALGGVVVAASVLFLLRGPTATSDTPSGTSEVQTLAKAVVDTEVEVARKRLENREYEEAARRAERALRFEPGHAEARKILDEARRVVSELEAGVAAARGALAEGRPEPAAEALWKVLLIEPGHAGAAELIPSLNPHFQARAQEARRLMTRARQQAQEANLSLHPSYSAGAGRADEGDAHARAQHFAAAARAFLEARNLFGRAASGGR